MPKLGFNSSRSHYIERCPYCGDSNNSTHGHLYINVQTGLYYCQKCGASGKQQYGQFATIDIESPKPINHEPDIVTHDIPYSPRASILPRKSALFGGKYWDYFPMFNPLGEQTGYHLRRSKPDKQSHTHVYKQGLPKGISYHNASLTNPLISSLDNPLTIVEGVFDAISQNEVCVFGSITPSTSKYFKTQYVNIRFDGDVWIKNKSLAYRTIDAYYQNKHLYLLGVYVILNGLDIDEVTSPELVKYVNRDMLPELLEFLRETI